MEKEVKTESRFYLSSFIGGGVAGIFVDCILFPLDTLKTRLQAEKGFYKSGGFKGLYKGIGPQAIGGAPQAALFFLTYETIKFHLEHQTTSSAMLPLLHMTAASIGEVAACLVRVPMEVVKQRRQTHPKNKSSIKIVLSAYKYEGIKGLYRGFGSTIIREIPFSIIQFPIWEFLKLKYKVYMKNNIPLESYEVALCGSIAGGFSAAVTTPLDVVKTRIMLADRKLVKTKEATFIKMFKYVYKNDGFKGLFSGFLPRTLWITLGGYIFFGSYDFSKNLCSNLLSNDDNNDEIIVVVK